MSKLKKAMNMPTVGDTIIVLKSGYAIWNAYAGGPFPKEVLVTSIEFDKKEARVEGRNHKKMLTSQIIPLRMIGTDYVKIKD